MAKGNQRETLYLIITIIRENNIIPLFVFDGKSSTRKEKTLQERREGKITAEKEYNELLSLNKDNPISNRLKHRLSILKRKMIRIDDTIIENAKKIMDAYGAMYYQCEGEADVVIAAFAKKKIIWGCMSDDTDLLVYGCNNVLRCLSLLNERIILYDTKNIIKNLNLTHVQFKEICVLAGTDYNETNISLYDAFSLFEKYKRECFINNSYNKEFYTWLSDTTKVIEDYDELINTYNMFEINCKFNKFKVHFNSMNINELKCIMENEGFIFI